MGNNGRRVAWRGKKRRNHSSCTYSSAQNPALLHTRRRRPSKAQSCKEAEVAPLSCCACCFIWLNPADAGMRRNPPSPACPLLVRGHQTEAGGSPGMSRTQRPVPSPYPKPRLKWTSQLHERFLEAVALLGGANRATPKSVKRAMGVPGLTLYHLKSHLQKYRLAVKRSPEASCNYREADIMAGDFSAEENQSAHVVMAPNQAQINESMLQMHVEVERKLREQIEVQRHLQLRIEAQGRYLQSALRKAHEMLAGRSLASAAVEAAQSELSELVSVSVVDADCLSSSCSGGNPAWPRQADCSGGDSCLTSWAVPEVKHDKLCKPSDDAEDISSDVEKPGENREGCDGDVRNRGRSNYHEDNCVERKSCYRASGGIDLNMEPMSPRSSILEGAPVLQLS